MMKCACGCSQETTVFKGKPRTFINGHHSRKSAAMFSIEPAGYKTPCWIWKLGRVRGGYGTIKRDGISISAHTWIYRMAGGRIDADKELDHLCRKRDCVRPDHLEPVHRKVNCRRGLGTKFPQEVIDQLYGMNRMGVTNTLIARELGVSKQHVGNILKGIRRVG